MEPGIGSSEQLSLLISRTRSSTASERANAIRLLVKMGSEAMSAWPGIVSLAGDESYLVRLMVAWAIGHMIPLPSDALQALRALLNDPHPTVQAVAKGALHDLIAKGTRG